MKKLHDYLQKYYTNIYPLIDVLVLFDNSSKQWVTVVTIKKVFLSTLYIPFKISDNKAIIRKNKY